MFNTRTASKIKNEKIARWKMEHSCFSFDTIYRSGKENAGVDALSRICSAIPNTVELRTLHNELCHPGITRMTHAVWTRNLSYSTDDVKRITKSCKLCSEYRFFKFKSGTLITATQPFERLNIDFKGPLPSESENLYMLTVIDEYSRLPFAFPCPKLSANSVIQCLCSLFSIFGLLADIHSDRENFLYQKNWVNFFTRKEWSQAGQHLTTLKAMVIVSGTMG